MKHVRSASLLTVDAEMYAILFYCSYSQENIKPCLLLGGFEIRERNWWVKNSYERSMEERIKRTSQFQKGKVKFQKVLCAKAYINLHIYLNSGDMFQ